LPKAHGTYAWMQLRAALLSGAETARYFSSGLSGQSEIVASVFKCIGWLFGGMLGIFIRLEVGLPMIPIQALVGLGHDSRQETQLQPIHCPRHILPRCDSDHLRNSA
jgi:hypothetical protein